MNKKCFECRDQIEVKVRIPADLSHTGKAYWKETPIDKCLAEIIRVFNENKIYTRGCCCGHGSSFGDIHLDDGRVLLVVDDAIYQANNMQKLEKFIENLLKKPRRRK